MKLKEYGMMPGSESQAGLTFVIDDLLRRARDVVTYREPHTTSMRSFKNWLLDWNPMLNEENQLIHESDDLIAIYEGNEDGALDLILGRILSKLLPKNVSHAQENWTSRRLQSRIGL